MNPPGKYITSYADTPVEVTEVRKLKRASGTFRNGVIEITVPLWWPRKDKLEAIQSLIKRLVKKKLQDEAILSRGDDYGPRITIATLPELTRYVHALNAETFNVPLKKVRMGTSKYSQLAQMNIKTQTMTVSRYCTHNVPVSALRYLIVHELAHLLEASHNAYFWSLVARFVPDYKKQSKLIKTFHHHAVEHGLHDLAGEDIEAVATAPKTEPGLIKENTQTRQLHLF